MTRTFRSTLFNGLLLGLGLAVLATGHAFAAQQCRDEKGKFIKCPPAAEEPAVRCRNVKTKKFAKCGTPDTEPVPAKPK